METNEKNINETGGISVQTEHIFPIIKKWLYSEKEIFLREIVSNACDAVTKLRRLSSLGEVQNIDDNFKITVTVNEEERTLTVSDNGIGMTADEVKKYICQMALSGALDFIQKYENDSDSTAQNGIIGHFGLGFYSAFMVSDTVEVITKSYTGAPAVSWVCSEAGQYEMSDSDKSERGTDVIMHIADSENEFLRKGKISEILNRYCSFMPVEIYLNVIEAETDDKKDESPDKNDTDKKPEEPKPINDIHPLWQKNPSDCTDEEYDALYKKVFNDYKEPLFHVHINADYPLNFKGILYFPKINHEYDSLEGQVKLYYNQVFVADNIKEVIPEYMLMLKGVLDCPELPLNVSRSYLQSNGYVAKVSAHIVKKVADKINGMFTNDRANYEKIWNDIKLFVEYGSLKDSKFFDRVKPSILLPLTDGSYKTVDEYLENAKETHENVVYYANDKVSQAQYISMFTNQNIEVVLLDRVLDTQFITTVEQDKKIKFMRIDSDIADALKGDGEIHENNMLRKLFIKASGNPSLKVSFQTLKDAKVPAVLNISEESRRFDDMMKMYRFDGMGAMPTESTLVLNYQNSLVRRIEDNLTQNGLVDVIDSTDKEAEKTVADESAKSTDDASDDSAKEPVKEESIDFPAEAERAAKQIYTLALLSQRQLTADELQSFLNESFSILEKSL